MTRGAQQETIKPLNYIILSNKLSSKKVILGIVLMIAIVCIILCLSLLKKLPEVAPQTNKNRPATDATPTPDQATTADVPAQAQPEPEKLTPVRNVPPTAKPTQTELDKIDASNWKTYTNTKYGYKIKYPSDWSIITREDYQVNFLAPETPKFDPNEPGWGDVSIGMQNSGPSDAPDQYFAKTQIALSKGNGTLYTGVNCGQDPQYPDISCTVANLTKDSVVNMNYFDELEKKDGVKYIGIYYKMLDTFKFIE